MGSIVSSFRAEKLHLKNFTCWYWVRVNNIDGLFVKKKENGGDIFLALSHQCRLFVVVVVVDFCRFQRRAKKKNDGHNNNNNKLIFIFIL